MGKDRLCLCRWRLKLSTQDLRRLEALQGPPLREKGPGTHIALPSAKQGSAPWNLQMECLSPSSAIAAPPTGWRLPPWPRPASPTPLSHTQWDFGGAGIFLS